MDPVAPSLVSMAGDLYKASGVPAENIALSTKLDAGHGFITEDAGSACDASKTPFLNDCDYDQAGAILGRRFDQLNSSFIPAFCTVENQRDERRVIRGRCRLRPEHHGFRIVLEPGHKRPTDRRGRNNPLVFAQAAA